MHKAPYIFPVIGGRKVEHLHANIEALDISLSPEQMKYLNDTVPFNKGFPYLVFVSLTCDVLKGSHSHACCRATVLTTTSYSRRQVTSTSGLPRGLFVLERSNCCRSHRLCQRPLVFISQLYTNTEQRTLSSSEWDDDE